MHSACLAIVVNGGSATWGATAPQGQVSWARPQGQVLGPEKWAGGGSRHRWGPRREQVQGQLGSNL